MTDHEPLESRDCNYLRQVIPPELISFGARGVKTRSMSRGLLLLSERRFHVYLIKHI